VSLYFQFGRYLLISSSRPGTLPSNLQGIWNKDYLPPWDSKYTININTQMNYWPAEVCNLSECHLPLFDLIERMRENGRRTARVMYNCRGFCAIIIPISGPIRLRRIFISVQPTGRWGLHGYACICGSTMNLPVTGNSLQSLPDNERGGRIPAGLLN